MSMMHIIEKENKWFERGIREAIHVQVENPSLSRGEGLVHNPSPIYQTALSSVPLRTASQRTHLCLTINLSPTTLIRQPCPP